MIELLAGDRCRLVVMPLRGGRWRSEAIQLVESLATSRAREEPPALARSAFLEAMMDEYDLHLVMQSLCSVRHVARIVRHI